MQAEADDSARSAKRQEEVLLWAVGEQGHAWGWVEVDWSKWPTQSNSSRRRLLTCLHCRLVRRAGTRILPCRGSQSPPHRLQGRFWESMKHSLAVAPLYQDLVCGPGVHFTLIWGFDLTSRGVQFYLPWVLILPALGLRFSRHNCSILLGLGFRSSCSAKASRSSAACIS